jgi:hypothetical protein
MTMAIDQYDLDAVWSSLEHVRRLDIRPETREDIPQAKMNLMVATLQKIANHSADLQAKRLAKIATESLNYPKHRCDNG